MGLPFLDCGGEAIVERRDVPRKSVAGSAFCHGEQHKQAREASGILPTSGLHVAKLFRAASLVGFARHD